jgi:hypothetical protein
MGRSHLSEFGPAPKWGGVTSGKFGRAPKWGGITAGLLFFAKGAECLPAFFIFAAASRTIRGAGTNE